MWEFYFSNADFNEIPVDMSSDWSPTPETVNLVPRTLSGWGTLPWGTFPWGSGIITAQIIPTWPTKNTNYAHWVVISLNLTQAFTALSLDGIALTFDIISTRGR